MGESNSVWLNRRKTKEATKLCRICLQQDDDMISLLDGTEHSKELLSKLVSMLQPSRVLVFGQYDPSYICNDCEIKLYSFTRFMAQCRKNDELIMQSTLFTCKYCNSIFNDPKEVEQHIVNSWKCSRDRDREVHGNIDGLTQHEIFLRNKFNNLQCPCCKTYTISKKNLLKHIHRVHGADVSRWCVTCNGLYDNLQLHLKDHCIDFTCPFCKKEFARLETVLDHLSAYIGVMSDFYNKRLEPNKKLCPHCGKEIKSNKLAVHLRTHTGETPYNCQHCAKKFRTRNALKSHERTHTGEKPFICSVCGKRFSQSNVLNTHMKIHTGKPEQCTLCSKRFCRPSELKLHMRTHTGEKPFPCTLCDQEFKQSSHLMEHINRHNQTAPFEMYPQTDPQIFHQDVNLLFP